MKRLKLAALLLCIAVLCACGASDQNGESTPEAPQQKQEAPQTKEVSVPIYAYEEKLANKQFTDKESSNIYASYSYHVPMMYIANADHLADDALATAQRNMESFNAYMQEVLDKSILFGEELALELEGGYFAMPAADEKRLTITQAGQIITVWVDGYFYSGGAHPYVYVDSYTFDLTVGQFIDPTQIGDDPETFRMEVAALLVAQAEGLGDDYTSGYWNDYREIIALWNEAAVLFDDKGMTVIFSAYELGPYAMGPVELFLTYEEIADAIGEGGLEHLGVLDQ